MSDKLEHFTIYAVLAFLAARATDRWPGLAVRGVWLWVAAGVALYGASDELHQSFVPTREMSLLDWIADALGALAGSALWWTIRGRLTGRR
jgi:VanZ family protein